MLSLVSSSRHHSGCGDQRKHRHDGMSVEDSEHWQPNTHSAHIPPIGYYATVCLENTLKFSSLLM